jgi:hypothetical protein
MIRVANDAPQRVLSFVRENPRSKVLALFNFSADARSVRLPETLAHGDYRDAFDNTPVVVTAAAAMQLPAWGYRVLVRAESPSGARNGQ